MAQIVIQRFKAQRTRGIDGFGFYLPQLDRLTHNIREGRILRLMKRTNASEILFHHRFPTSTLNVRRACHPFSTKDTFKNNYVTVHNGILSNEDDLAAKHFAKHGIAYVSKQFDGSFNDSEALAYDIALYLEGKQKELKAEGSIAFVTVKRNKQGEPEKLYFGRNYGSPLKLQCNKHRIIISSEGKGQDVEPHKLYEYDYATGKLTTSDLEIPDTVYTALPPGGWENNHHGGWKARQGGYDWNAGSRPRATDADFDWRGDDVETAEDLASSSQDAAKVLSAFDKVNKAKESLLQANHNEPELALADAELVMDGLKEEMTLAEEIVTNPEHNGNLDDWSRYEAVKEEVKIMERVLDELEYDFYQQNAAERIENSKKGA